MTLLVSDSEFEFSTICCHCAPSIGRAHHRCTCILKLLTIAMRPMMLPRHQTSQTPGCSSLRIRSYSSAWS